MKGGGEFCSRGSGSSAHPAVPSAGGVVLAAGMVFCGVRGGDRVGPGSGRGGLAAVAVGSCASCGGVLLLRGVAYQWYDVGGDSEQQEQQQQASCEGRDTAPHVDGGGAAGRVS
eukprot:CAMPEP_0114423622 /NCGR_PEP_ID=MMETSP0103-20121206/6250_1 /TAXON_ID=37642 ORGANISM="Paraphysomonas imperforata, Strain PA2" /NCGR_SAMPLE_ID=MMETSP0103 /ASSEMBLY_ACC=CAM_ASM_000201 /LENGTH=113 /DNA_ID=CAMNT_0001592303 /DNA_START=389 /DNA_END=729 /DNA_ORIENTATION=-